MTDATTPEAERLPDGKILMWDDGQRRALPRWAALLTAGELQNSPIKASRERAVAIRRACLEIVQ